MAYKKRKVKINIQIFKFALLFEGMTLKDLCKKTGESFNTVRQCINHGEIMPDTLQTLCDGLRIPLEEVRL